MLYKLSLIYRQKLNGGGKHYGVLLNNNSVLDVQKKLSVISLEDFTKNGKFPITIEATELVSELELDIRLSQLKDFVYSLFSKNCEHVSRWLVQGKLKSTQVEDAFGFSLMMTGIYLLLKIGKK